MHIEMHYALVDFTPAVRHFRHHGPPIRGAWVGRGFRSVSGRADRLTLLGAGLTMLPDGKVGSNPRGGACT